MLCANLIIRLDRGVDLMFLIKHLRRLDVLTRKWILVCIFNGTGLQDNVYILLYVDDLIIITGSKEKMEMFKMDLMKRFDMVDLKEIKLFLGIRITRTASAIQLDQTEYIKTILKRFNMENANSRNTPQEHKMNLKLMDSDEQCEAPCKNVMGCLRYIMKYTRPDINITVNILSRYATKGNLEVWNNIERLLKYLSGTKDL